MGDPRTAKRFLSAALVIAVLSSCGSVLRKDLLQTGVTNFSLDDLVTNPDVHRGTLFVLGGTILHTTPDINGTLIDAVYIPVNASGYLKRREPDGRFIALYPWNEGEIDPARGYANVQITLAGVFTGIRAATDGETTYTLPVFRIEQIYVWPTDSYYTSYYLSIGCPGPYWGPYWGPYFAQPYWPHLYPLCAGRHWPDPLVLGNQDITSDN